MKLYYYLAAMVLGLFFVSCSGDDSDGGSKEPPSDGKIVGTWKSPQQSGSSADFTYIQFGKDGSLIKVSKYNWEDDCNIKIGTYKLSSNNLSVIYIINGENDGSSDIYSYDNKLYINGEQWIRVDDSYLNSYVIKHNTKEDLKQYEVNLDKYKVDLKKFLFDLDQYKVDIDEFEVSFPNVNVDFCPDKNHPHAIDMGAAGKWACCNVEASNPDDWGGYYAWGETEQEERIGYYYQENRYKYYDGTWKNLGDDIAGTSYDVAHVQWGGKWKMPSAERFQALIDNTTRENITLFGDANIDNCYYINDKFYRIEDVKSYKLINGNVYKISDISNCFLIDGEAYKIENIQNYYIINGVVYKLDKSEGYFAIDGKIYKISDADNIYVNGNNLYIIPNHPVVKGADKLSESEDIQLPKLLEADSFVDISTNVLNLGIYNVWLGTKFTSTNGNSIYFPAAGYLWNGMEWDFYGGLFYWSSSLSPSDISQAYRLKYVGDWTGINVLGYRRGAGLPVRPVM